jgi:predicted esterase
MAEEVEGNIPSHQQPKLRLGEFTPPIIVPPLIEPHRQSIILLHGRGSNAPKFVTPLLGTAVPGFTSLQAAFPHARLVFPTAPRLRATLYRRSIINQWFDGSGDWEPTVMGHMKPTVDFIHGLLRHEIELVGGDAQKVVLGGLSQGCATSLISLLLWEGDPFGAMVGMCGFLPMTAYLRGVMGETQRGQRGGSSLVEGSVGHEEQNEDDEDDIFAVDPADDAGAGKETPGGRQSQGESESDGDSGSATPTGTRHQHQQPTPLSRAIGDIRAEVGIPPSRSEVGPSFLPTPVFLGHGTMDERVEIQFGRDAGLVLRMMGLDVEFVSYEGLGHWYSPQMLADAISFLKSRLHWG